MIADSDCTFIEEKRYLDLEIAPSELLAFSRKLSRNDELAVQSKVQLIYRELFENYGENQDPAIQFSLGRISVCAKNFSAAIKHANWALKCKQYFVAYEISYLAISKLQKGEGRDFLEIHSQLQKIGHVYTKKEMTYNALNKYGLIGRILGLISNFFYLIPMLVFRVFR